MKRFSCIIFDLDGTLTQTNELIFATFNHVTEKYVGKVFSPKEITGMFGPPEEIAIERIVGKERVDEALVDFFKFYEAHHQRMANAYHGVQDILEYLKEQGILLAIFTGKGRRSTLITLNALGIKHYFDLIVTGTDVVEHKPSSEGIKNVLSTFGLETNEVLMVGDAVNDIKAAHEAGVQVAAVVWDSYGKKHVMQMETDFLFHSVEEFGNWIRSVVHRSALHTVSI
ncbi:MAG: HAD family hydrolase [Ignavibacteriae bacterium]|nr:HAD family hydrolase [Ignavibacteriota bacterium]